MPFVPKKQVLNWIDQANEQIRQQDYQGLAQICRRVLRDAPPKSQTRVDALEYLASAYTMLKQFENAYQTLSKLLEIDPDYDPAKQNLAMLPMIRRSGKTPKILLRDSFADTNVSLDLQ